MAPTKADGPIEGVMASSTASTTSTAAAPTSTPHPETSTSSNNSLSNPSLHSDFSLLVNQEVNSLQNRAEAERSQIRGQDDLAEEAAAPLSHLEAAIESAMGSRSSSPLSDDDWLMTKSQFAQVLFHDVADSYPNDGDLLVHLRLNGSDLEVEHGDRVGLFRMGHIAAHQSLLFAWVKSGEMVAGKDKEFKIVFKGADLPKSEDFYQYQYLRSDNTVLGASIPFELRLPKNEELIAVENNDSFMVVQSQQAVLSGHMSDVEKKYSELLEVSQKLNEDLLEKNESFIELDKQYKSILTEKQKFEKLKEDLKSVIDAKVNLEEKLSRVEGRCRNLEKELVGAKRSQDESSEQALKASQEKSFFRTENGEMVKKVEDLNSMLNALGKSKELAVEEIRTHMAQKEQLEKEVSDLKEDLRRSDIQKGDLQQCLNALGSKHENLERKFAQMTKERETLNLSLEAEIEKYKARVSAVEQQREITQAQFKFEESRNQTLMERIRELEAATSGQQQNSHPGFARRENGGISGSGDSAAVVAADGETFSLRSDASSMTDYESLYIDGQNRITKLENTVKQLQLGLATAQEEQSIQVSRFKEELDEIRNRSVTSSYAPSDTSSARNMDSAVIREALNQWAGNEIDSFENSAVAAAGDDKDQSKSEVDASAQSHPVVNQPLFTGTKPKSYRPATPPTPQIPCSPPTHARFPPVRQLVHTFMPQFPGSILSHKLFQPPQNESSEKDKVKVESLPDPLVPERVEAVEVSRASSEKPEEKDFNELMAWANNGAKMTSRQTSRGSSEEGSRNSFTLTDDGRPVPAAEDTEKEKEDGAISCPICDKTFRADQTRELEFHVDTHLITTLTCPVCSTEYPKTSEDEFKDHVELHFADEGFTLMESGEGSSAGNSEDETGRANVDPQVPQPASRPGVARPVRPAPKEEEEEEEEKETPAERFRNWFLDID